MINLGKKDVKQSKDKWTIFAKDRKPSAHYEHTVAVRKQQADILSDHVPIEDAIERNPELKSVELLEAYLV
jgi:methionyl aminopeptidase